MADVSHELGALRFVVDSPLSSKVAMFNNQVSQHKQAQLLNPFSNSDGGRVSPKPQFSKDEYGKPLAGSLTEMRGQKANIHVMKEMLELCQIIDSEGYDVKDEPKMRVIPFGELFNIYNYISDKVVGILLRARKHKLVEFEGEMLFQRRDDNVPVFLLMPIQEIRHLLDAKMEEIKRASSPAPQATSVLLDKSAHSKKLQEKDTGLGVPKKSGSKSRTPSPTAASTVTSRPPTPPTTAVRPAPELIVQQQQASELKAETKDDIKPAAAELAEQPNELKPETKEENKPQTEDNSTPKQEQITPEIRVVEPPQTTEPTSAESSEPAPPAVETLPSVENTTDADVSNNKDASEVPPTVIMEASAVYVLGSATEAAESTTTNSSTEQAAEVGSNN